MRLALRPLAVLLFALLGLYGAFAQSAAAPPPAQSQALDGVRASLERIEKALERPDVSDAALQSLRSELEPLGETIAEALDDLTPKLESAKSRLEQFGAKPAESATPEGQAAIAERREQQKAFDDIDAQVKRARLLAVQAEQTAANITNRRRAIFRQALFQRSFSLVSPQLWYLALTELPRDLRAMGMLASDWGSGVAVRLHGSRLASFLAAFAALVLAFGIVRTLAHRVLARPAMMHEPSRLRKAASALWVAAVMATVPIAAALALIEIARFYDLFSVRLEPLVATLFDAVRRTAIALATARALLSPDKPEWRLLNLSTPTSERLFRLAVTIALIVSAMKIMDAVNDLIAARVAASVWMRGLGCVAVAGIMAYTLYGLAPKEEDNDDLGPRITPKRDWYALWRAAAWAAIVAIVGSALVGFVALASFLVDQIVWVTFVGAVAYMLHELTDEAFQAALQPNAAAARAATQSIGLRRDSLRQLAILLRGVSTLVITLVGAMLVLAPWGVESDDMLGNLRAAFFGFRVGEVTISLASVLIALLLFSVGVAATRIVQGWLEQEYLPSTHLDVGLRNSIRTSVGYIGFILALALALAQVGLNFERLAIVAGALSIGVGFGLQSIVNNFVSGLILLWERAIRVGDWVVIGDEQGYVRRINVRSTEIETFDRATMIVPNSNLVTGVVKNWVRSDRVGRIKIPVSVAMAADPGQVRQLLLDCAAHQDTVLEFPAPQVMFTAMVDATLKFELVCFVGDVEKSQKVRSDLNFAIFGRFREAHIDISPPPAAPVVVKIGN
ncbi:MAG: Mechanosensitive ion channel protein MscS [Hyphomicrobiales bacterium]|nr:Mechanosensitive ion channel protein MscS [Hyphomicrobiales bacterium]